jgi:hypothetical protein
MSNTYVTKLLKDMNETKNVPITAAEKPHLERFENNLNNAVNNGMTPDSCLRSVTLLTLLHQHGLPLDMIENNLNLILTNININNINLSDENIDNIISLVRKAESDKLL